MTIRSLFLAAAIPWRALPAELPGPVLPAGVGVNIHFTRGHERDLDMIAAAGFRFIRMDFGWAAIERKKGEYEWSEYEELTASLEKRGIRPYYILDYSNPLYEETVTGKNPISGAEHRDTASPQHPQSVAAFARWAAAAAQHFHGRHVVWEIWNEPNISFWKPKPDAGQYTALALATCKAVRAADPQATIVAPATSTFPWEFLDRFLKSGVLEYLDGVSVHPYRSKERPPETATADYQRLRGLIERYAPDEAGKKIPIISGEWGYSSNTKGVSPEIQAAFIARQQLSNLLNGVPISIWYDWKNDGEDPNENEHNFGTVIYNLKPKPAYTAIQTLTRELSGYRIARRHDTGNEKDFVLVLMNANGETKLAVWTVGEAHNVTLGLMPTTATTITCVGSGGEKRKLRVEGNRLIVELTAAPGYLSLDQVKLK
ncbi:MAG TPA: cellulase family glycosylhydrolase [Candidatus Angelobacter sp.]|nr:cellulase family glycosylhydrolase [Candidatus Angelobacter sp.]